MLIGKDVLYQLTDSESRFYFIEDRFYPQMKGVISNVKLNKVVVIGGNERNENLVSFEEILRSYSDRELDKVLNIWDPVTIMYTSGTESLPKGVIHTNQSLIAEYVSTIIGGRYEPRDVVIHALPLYHCAQKDVS